MDGGLRILFRKHIPSFHWTSIESGMTGSGIPDSEYCSPAGESGWIEHKGVLNGWKPEIRPAQVAWLTRRARMGGRAFIAVRREAYAGPKRGPAVDELWLIKGSAAPRLRSEGLKGLLKADMIGVWWSGVLKWDWGAIAQHLTNGVR